MDAALEEQVWGSGGGQVKGGGNKNMDVAAES